MRELKVVKPNAGSSVVVPSVCLQAIFPLMTTARSARYALEGVQANFDNAKVSDTEPYREILSVFQKMADYQEKAEPNSDALYAGKEATTRTYNAQVNAAAELISTIDTSKPIRFDFAVSDQSELIGVFTADGQKLEEDSEAGMNNLLLAWLSKNNWINQDGVVLKINENGATAMKDGKPVRVDPTELREKMVDNQAGFSQYAKQAKENIQLTIYAQPFTPVPVSPEPTATNDSTAPAVVTPEKPAATPVETPTSR